MSRSNCCFLACIQISQGAGQVVWYSHLFQNFPQFIVIHTVKGLLALLFFRRQSASQVSPPLPCLSARSPPFRGLGGLFFWLFWVAGQLLWEFPSFLRKACAPVWLKAVLGTAFAVCHRFRRVVRLLRFLWVLPRFLSAASLTHVLLDFILVACCLASTYFFFFLFLWLISSFMQLWPGKMRG